MLNAGFLLVSLCALAFGGGKGFQDLSLEQALAKAKAENKYVFIDFYTTWCAPCKLMANTTFQDPQVIAWLEEHTLALAVDADAQSKLAKRFDVKVYPTLLWLKSDGTTAYRLDGSRNTDQFLLDCAAAIDSERPDERAREALTADPDNPLLQYRLASALVSVGKFDQGLAAAQPLLAKIRSGAIGQLNPAAIYFLVHSTRLPAAQKLLKAESAYWQSQLLAGHIDDLSVKAFDSMFGMVKSKTPLQLYDTLKRSGTPMTKLAPFRHATFRQMFNEGRYAEIDQLASIESRVQEMEAEVAKMKSKEAREMMTLTNKKTDMYQVLKALKADERAKRLADRILAVDQDAYAYNGLAWVDYELKRLDAQSLAWAERANQLGGGQNTDILDTYGRVLAAMGQRERAITALKAALATLPAGKGRKDVQTCLDDISRE